MDREGEGVFCFEIGGVSSSLVAPDALRSSRAEASRWKGDEKGAGDTGKRSRPVVFASIWMDEFLVVLAGGCEVEVEVGK